MLDLLSQPNEEFILDEEELGETYILKDWDSIFHLYCDLHISVL